MGIRLVIEIGNGKEWEIPKIGIEMIQIPVGKILTDCFILRAPSCL